MSETMGTIVSAAAGVGGALVGGIAAWLGARAQARAELDAMKLQVSGTREDALWDGRRAGLSTLLSSHEQLRSHMAEMIVVRHLDAPLVESFAGMPWAEHDRGYHDLYFKTVQAYADARLWVPEAKLGIARTAAAEQGRAHGAMLAWHDARREGLPTADALYEDLKAAAAAYRETLRNFGEQARLYLEAR